MSALLLRLTKTKRGGGRERDYWSIGGKKEAGSPCMYVRSCASMVGMLKMMVCSRHMDF